MRQNMQTLDVRSVANNHLTVLYDSQKLKMTSKLCKSSSGDEIPKRDVTYIILPVYLHLLINR